MAVFIKYNYGKTNGGVDIYILKRLFCKHTYEFVRNIYGDEIRYLGWKRSVWKCSKCGKIKYLEHIKE